MKWAEWRKSVPVSRMGEGEEGIRGLILLPPWLAGEGFAREILGYIVLPRGCREAKKKKNMTS